MHLFLWLQMMLVYHPVGPLGLSKLCEEINLQARANDLCSRNDRRKTTKGFESIPLRISVSLL